MEKKHKQTSRKVNRCLIVLVLVLISTMGNWISAFCQDNYKTPVIEASPTSSVFARYGTDQPSLQYGSVNIPISLFDVKAQGIAIPFTLSYQTSGINAADTPYPAGYGWVFSSGFRISRKMMGRADDMFPFKQLNGSEDYETLKKGIIIGNYNLHLIADTSLYDSQKDVFTLSLPTGSYNFFINRIDSLFEIVSIGNKLKIKTINGVDAYGKAYGILGFKVTDENGVVYVFAGESSPSSNYIENEGWYISTWALKEIQLLNGDKIYFTWQKTNINTYALHMNSPVETVDYKYDQCNSAIEVNDPGGMIDYSTSSGNYALMLKKVEFPSGTVDLTYKSTTDPFLQSVVLKNKNSEVIKNISFAFGSGSDQTLLQSLTVNDEKYSFEYNAQRFGPGSTAVDYWGYYNGKTTNPNHVPKMIIKLLNNTWSSIFTDTEVGYADRSVDTAYMKAFMLTKITYPTGGFSKYEYEAHQFAGQYAQSTNLFTTQPAPLTMGGGLRVKEIKTYESVGATPIIKTYKYGTNEDGLANISSAPTIDTFIDEYWFQIQGYDDDYCSLPVHYWPTRRVMKINSLSNYNKFMINRPPIWYSEVTEYINNEIKTTSTFDYGETYGISFYAPIVAVKISTLFRYSNLFTNGPSLISNTSYKKVGSTYQKVRKVLNEYDVVHDLNNDVTSAVIDRVGIYGSPTLSGPDLFPDSFYPSGLAPGLMYYVNFLDMPYTISLLYKYLKKSTTTDYDGSNELSDSIKYTYSGEYLTSTTKGSSITGKETTVELKYPIDFADPIYATMVAKNMVAPVIEEKTTKGSTVIKKVKTNFTDNTSITTGLIQPASIETTNLPGTSTTTEVTFEKYDAKGNILQKSFLNGTKVSYIWSYGSTYPVAEITNADYATVVTALGGQTAVDTFSAASQSDSAIQSFLSALRTDVSLKNALVNTYTYKPLVGITSQVDAKGMAIYYEYDSLQHLINIKDQNGHIVKNFVFHFKAFGNDELSQVFTRNNCSSGNIGGQVTYTIPADTYTSAVSKSAANALASAAIATLGQAYANANASCTPCSGLDKKAINGVCETGVKIYTSSIPKPGGVYQCRFYYQWSDNSTSDEYIENGMPSPCIEE